MTSGQCAAPGKSSACAQFFFDAEKLVVLGDAVGTRRGTGLDLAGAHGDDEIGDEGVFGFAGAVRDDGGVASLARDLDGVDGFRDAADLIELYENRVGDFLLDATAKISGLATKISSPTNCRFVCRGFSSAVAIPPSPVRPSRLRAKQWDTDAPSLPRIPPFVPRCAVTCRIS